MKHNAEQTSFVILVKWIKLFLIYSHLRFKNPLRMSKPRLDNIFLFERKGMKNMAFSYYHFNFENISRGEKVLKMKILLSKEKKKENQHNLISWETRALLKVVNIIKKIISQPQKKISQHGFEEGYLNLLKDQLLFVRITMKVNREHWQALFS